MLRGYFYEASAVAQRFVPRWDVMCDVGDGWRTSGTGPAANPYTRPAMSCYTGYARTGGPTWVSLCTGPTDISIGRQLYTSIMTVRDAGWTCKLPGGRASLRIEYGVAIEMRFHPPK
ncbi:MAG: hypothetical protein U7126_06910 [Microcoleus sp.]